MPHKTSRRDFIRQLAAGGAALAQIGCVRSAESSPINAQRGLPPSPIPTRKLGRTGVSIPIFGLGGAGQTPLSKPDREAEAIRLIEAALELGVRYFDTAANYGASEEQLGRVLPPYRTQIFLSSKTDQRTRDGAWRELERSLRRLKTDYLDLWQMHHVSFREELDVMMSRGGAIEAIEEAKRQRLIRFCGITGHHDPMVIAEGLRRYPFDVTLIALNAADVHHPRPFIKHALPAARERGVGVVAMKIPAYGRLLRPGLLTITEAISYVLSQPGVSACIIAAENPQQLAQNIQAARNAQALSAVELARLEERTAKAWQEIAFYRAWT
jgi:aryl-alcohol dehydrogenase-like predicted oxidoreductase